MKSPRNLSLSLSMTSTPSIILPYNKALKGSLDVNNKTSIPINTSSSDEMLSLIKTLIGTMFVARWSDLIRRLALQAVRMVAAEENGHKTVDIKRYACVEKIRRLDLVSRPGTKRPGPMIQGGASESLSWIQNSSPRLALCFVSKTEFVYR